MIKDISNEKTHFVISLQGKADEIIEPGNDTIEDEIPLCENKSDLNVDEAKAFDTYFDYESNCVNQVDVLINT